VNPQIEAIFDFCDKALPKAYLTCLAVCVPLLSDLFRIFDTSDKQIRVCKRDLPFHQKAFEMPSPAPWWIRPFRINTGVLPDELTYTYTVDGDRPADTEPRPMGFLRQFFKGYPGRIIYHNLQNT